MDYRVGNLEVRVDRKLNDLEQKEQAAEKARKLAEKARQQEAETHEEEKRELDEERDSLRHELIEQLTIENEGLRQQLGIRTKENEVLQGQVSDLLVLQQTSATAREAQSTAMAEMQAELGAIRALLAEFLRAPPVDPPTPKAPASPVAEAEQGSRERSMAREWQGLG